ncbi:MAG TPA: hypothetical protein VNN17_00105 [Terriglobia bacterium]|nr:hypothetical protein [Terriglobia bacterium]
MTLQEAIERYLEVAGEFGVAMPLSGFGRPQQEVEETLSAWDEDYHLHRHFELVPASWMAPAATAYRINGALYTDIILRETIREALG